MRLPAALALALLFACRPSSVPAAEPAADPAARPAARAVFEQLKALAGDWRSTRDGSATAVHYRAIANGSSLVETWTMSPTRQSMTVYTMDGDRLIATHYCPQGNAPRFVFARTGPDGTHHFSFLDGANLQAASGSHQHAFWIRTGPGGTLVRSETYIGNGATYDPRTDTGEEDAFARLE